ncbi:MAG: DNA gyrase subunit A [archaeon]
MENKNIKLQPIEEEMKKAYIDYAMSVIVSRALPDVKDGLKPVHRRILYAMNLLGLTSNKSFKKSAHVVGRVLSELHPHGDKAVYDSMVRMAQDFSLRYPLINGQGNWGSVDGDPAAAMRYTECKMQKISDELLVDISKETVDFVPNYDNSSTEPVVLPAKLPNLLLNGSTGIAVGMATNIPPHNLIEVCDAVLTLIKNPEADYLELMENIKAPDFPTGGIICGTAGVRSAYASGRGRVIVRGLAEIEEYKGKERIIITEIPYMVNKANLVEQIANLVKRKCVDGISDLRDESDRTGMRIVIELKKNVNSNVLLNQLYKHTQLQDTFGIIMLALVENQPKVLPLKKILTYYLDHRKNVIMRKTKFDLKKAEERAHILEGLQICLENVDEVVKLIKQSDSPVVAKDSLMLVYNLTEIQAQAILDMKLQRLTSLEKDKIYDEHKQLMEQIANFKDILSSEFRILKIIEEELTEIKQKYGDDRRTKIEEVEGEIESEELIENETVVITITHSGYVKRISIDEYKQQKRGGVGVVGASMKEEDVLDHLFVTQTHNYLLFFTNKGKVHWLKAYQVPEGSRYSKGKAIVNLIRLDPGEKISAAIPIKEFNKDQYLSFATKDGLIKKTKLKEYSRPRQGGIIAIVLREADELVNVRLTDGNFQLMLVSANGYAVRFKEKDVRSCGRNSMGVKGIKLGKDDEVVGLEVVKDGMTLLTITENGFGKRTPVEDYRLITRGGKGVINIKTTERNGKVVDVRIVNEDDEVFFMSQQGIIIRTSVKGISQIGRNTQGVRLMKLRESDKVTSLSRVVKETEEVGSAKD